MSKSDKTEKGKAWEEPDSVPETVPKGENMKKRRSTKRILLIVLLSVLSVCLVLAVVAGIMIKSVLSDIKRVGDETVVTLSREEIEAEVDMSDTTPVEVAPTIKTGNDIINILLVGQDRREGEGRQRSDAMIFCTINQKTNTMTMTSFLRDLWVFIPDGERGYNERLNVAYMIGGFDLLNATLEYNFGIRADYNFEIDFSGFMTAIDTIGGVEVELTRAEANYLNRRGNWEVEENQGWQLKEGVNLLTGSQALAYSRVRGIDSDFVRTGRQRTVLTALLEKSKTLGIVNTYGLVAEIAPLLTTDMTDGEIMSLAMDIVPSLSEMETVSQRIPMDGQWYDKVTSGGAQVIGMTDDQKAENMKLLENIMETEEPEETGETKQTQ